MNRSGVRVPKKAHFRLKLFCMLMFDNGLLATFIPEILMVLGYFLCLIFPQVKTEKDIVVQDSATIQIITIQQNQHSTYRVQITEFQTSESYIPEIENVPTFYRNVNALYLSNYIPDLTGGLNFKKFSRPPPFCFC